MTILEKIDDIYEKIHSRPLSTILPSMLPIALELEDYEGFCILFCWGRTLNKDKEANRPIYEEIKKILASENVEESRIYKILEISHENFISMRTIGKDQIMSFSAKEMEDNLKMLDELFASFTIPNNLHPYDTYAYGKKNEQSRITVMESRQIVEKQYSTLLSYISIKLVDYRRRAAMMENTKVVQEKIKNSKDIFIVHGHNEAKRRELVAILKEQFGLNPIVLLEQPDNGMTIIEKFEKYASNCSYAFALFTPDDIVINGDKEYLQARPNVIFELGWFYAKLGRSRVCILDQESEKSKIFTDLQGVMRMQYRTNISERYMEIERELKSVGII